jgi:hypothetical protein
MPISKLDAAVKKAAADRIITGKEAPAIIREAKKSGSKKPITDVFNAIHNTNASVDAKATRLICGSLDQKLSRAEWVSLAQKCASPSGVWGPGGDGTTKVARKDLPPAVRKIFDRWAASDSEDTPNVRMFKVAGKPAYLMDQYSEFGTSFALFDEAGKSIELKQDDENVRRETSRVQSMFDAIYRAPEMKAWSKALEHTDIGVLTDYSKVATELDGAKKDAALTGEVKSFVDDALKNIKKGESRVYRNKSDGSLLVAVQKSYSGPEKLGHFSKSGKLLGTYQIDV